MYTAAAFDDAGIEILLVGDSASTTCSANETSIPITVDELLPLTRRCPGPRSTRSWSANLPFGSYQRSPSMPTTPPSGS